MPRPIGAGDPGAAAPVAIRVGQTPGALEIAAQHVAHPAEIAGHQTAHRGAAIGAGLHREAGRRRMGIERLVEPALQEQRLAAQVVDRRIIGAMPQRPVERRDRFGEALLPSSAPGRC